MVQAATGAAGSAPAPATGAVVPFWYGSNIYARKFWTVTQTTDAASHDFVQNVPPQGFLSNIRLDVRSTSAVGGALTPDGVWPVFRSLELDDIDGGNILYPMTGYAHYLSRWFFHPWLGNPETRWDFASSINPSFTLDMMPELRHTACVLANTDARSQYKIQYTIAPTANFITANVTPPAITVNAIMECWAQPDSVDLSKNQIDPLPPGLNLQRKRRHQTLTLNAAGADNTLQTNLTGNEIRCIILVVRDSTNTRVDYLTDPIQWQLDDRNLGQFSPTEVFNLMNDVYPMLSDGTSSRPTGVYVFPRYALPGTLQGQSWLGTTNATFLQFETTTLATGVSLPGTVEMITDEIIPIGPLPMELESI